MYRKIYKRIYIYDLCILLFLFQTNNRLVHPNICVYIYIPFVVDIQLYTYVFVDIYIYTRYIYIYTSRKNGQVLISPPIQPWFKAYYMTLRYAMLGCSALHYIAIFIYIYIIYQNHIHYIIITCILHGESQIPINTYIFSHGEWTHFTIDSKRLSRTNVRI